ncbi:MAG: PQQ-binding-like beta-propeller repeat protein [Bryobacterales bacterium]|nr:PQQ-binding-like beta-propeller repeat protein [Bryobacterales bacterium]
MVRFLTALALAASVPAFLVADWPQFRGPNGSGTSDATDLPVEFGAGKNVLWKTTLPSGHSSPALSGDRIFLTAMADGKLWTICLSRQDGSVLWQREAPRDRISEMNRLNHPASPSPVTDGENVYVFFGDFGLLSYGPDGNERWRVPLGPFDNWMGMASSPIVVGNKVVLVCDQDTGSFMVAIDRDSGDVIWKTERLEYTRGFSTPSVYRPAESAPQLIVPGAYQVGGYSLENGAKLWWARGIAFEVKSLAITDDSMLYVHGWSSTGNAVNEKLPPYGEVLAKHDADGDGRFSEQEAFLPMMRERFGSYFDFDRDGFVDEGDWNNTQSRLAARNALLAIRLGGRGDLTESSIVWRYRRALPNVPSPLLYRSVLYLVKDGGILTSLDPQTGAVFKQGRLPGALGRYWASPVAADGKVYVASEEGQVTVLRASPEWEVLATNDLGDDVFATAAIEQGRIYFRTRHMLYCFGEGK